MSTSIRVSYAREFIDKVSAGGNRLRERNLREEQDLRGSYIEERPADIIRKLLIS